MTQREHRRSPVDVFFRALADAYGSRSVCAILSGTGPNGSAGLKRVKEYGGLVLAQSPDEAAYDDMPNNAIATGLVDIVLPAAEMPAQIADFYGRLQTNGAPRRRMARPTRKQTRCERSSRCCASGPGHDFTNYKSGTLLRRLQRRLNVTRPVHGERVRSADARAAVRGGVADEGSADQRHPFLSRSRRVRRARTASDPAALREQASRGPGSGVGRPLRHRRRGLLGRDAAVPSTSTARARGAARPGVRDRSRRGCDRDGERRPLFGSPTSPTCPSGGSSDSFTARAEVSAFGANCAS